MKRRLISNKKALHPQTGASHLRSEMLDSDMQARIPEVFVRLSSRRSPTSAKRQSRTRMSCLSMLKTSSEMVSARSDYEN
jgi:hypothetical protein